jgi:NAD+ synthase (glutamine-hydrolysing)
VAATYRKHRLPNYEVFDEERYFAAGRGPCVVELKGVRCGLAICADVWEPGAAEAAVQAGAELMLTLNASPFHMNKQARRYEVLRDRVAATATPVVYANLVGGQDELVFDGASFAMDGQGRLTHQSPAFVEALEFVDFADGHLLARPHGRAGPARGRGLCRAETGRRRLPRQERFSRRHHRPFRRHRFRADPGHRGRCAGRRARALRDDAVAVDGADEPRRFARDGAPARRAVRRDTDRIRNGAVRRVAGADFCDLGPKPAWDTTDENLQARIRGMLLMALSNRTGRIVLTTGNKSEMAVGYATLYGDMAGGFAVIKDVPKTFVYRLAEWRNTVSDVIPRNIITRPPSAELKPGQTDQDTLPPYEVLDAIIEAYMERDESPRQIIAGGIGEADVRKVVGMLKKNEYKRRQAPVGIRVTQRGFGKDWRYPITSAYADEW